MPRTDAADRHLRDLPLFAGVTDQQLGLIRRLCTELTLPRGRVLCEEGAPGVESFLILAGTAEVARGGRVVALVGPGDLVGEVAVVERGQRNATVRAVEPLRVLVFSSKELRAILDGAPAVRSAAEARIARRGS